ncbi:protein kinase [Nannocystis pusilla]|uniref:Protein kinase n=1 Tax=Nannocystis pusilla TaxID=889268 RepID=A0A9X3IWF6_9BACT|nr:protein kinase [Nannocystis pusilla]MCY1007302.1 protein kinase [Nannocystis pusilla]
MPWPALVRGLTQVLMALQYLHDCRVVHCDVKPANMFVTRDPNTRFLTTKLLDLGIAYDLDGPRPGPTEPLCGDPNYIALEQTMHGGVIDPRTDIYAIGVSLYELATGVLPFEELTTAPLHELLIAQRDQTPPPPSSRLPPARRLNLRTGSTGSSAAPARRIPRVATRARGRCRPR